MTLTPIMTTREIEDFIASDFPQVNMDGQHFSVVSVESGAAVMRLLPGPRHLRPGGTVSGPALFTLADVAAYVALLAHIGPVALAVTTNLNINFLRKPAEGNPLDATCRILKLGKRLAVVDVAIHDIEGDLVAHATATYSIPPRG